MSDATLPSPELFYETARAYQRTAALRAAIQLDVFTVLAGRSLTSDAVADHCGASRRGIRILCDYLAVVGLLKKVGRAYRLPSVSAMFLDRQSVGYLGGTVDFVACVQLMRRYDDLATTVRRGRPATDEMSEVAGAAMWVQHARVMSPRMVPTAKRIADLLEIGLPTRLRVLDIGAGHGMFGIVIAERNEGAEVWAVDCADVLKIARDNATAAGVDRRYHCIAGDAFDVEFGAGRYDVTLVANVLHNFGESECVRLLKKIAGHMHRGGRIVVVELVANGDRVSPPIQAAFGLTMLASTTNGEVYTLRQLRTMLREAGFHRVKTHALATLQTVVIANR